MVFEAASFKAGEGMTDVCYYTNGKGSWLRREWKPQCPAKVFIYGRCQGVKGHRGVHWCYSPSGDFQWDDNDDDPKHDGCAGSTPPGHKSYAPPLKMEKYYYMSHYTDAEVTDKTVIALLEKEKTPERDASINKPVTDKAIIASLKKRTKQERAIGIKSRVRKRKRRVKRV